MGQLGDLSPQGSVAVGVFVGLASTSIQSVGLTLQRKSHILEDEKESDDHRRPPFRRRRWQLGMLMFVVANLVGSSIQITTLPLPVLSTLQASGLVFNSICATLILGEAFTRYSLGGTILVCAGALLIAIFGAISEPAHNLDQLLFLLGRRQFILWMIGQAILVVAIIVGAKAVKLMNPRTSNSPRMRLFRGMAYGCLSGILSAHSLLVAKSAVELLVRTIVDRHNEFNRWQSWIILLGLLALALTQLYYLHRGLRLCSTSILYPFVFCVYNIIAIFDGLIYFHQTDRLSTLHALLVSLLLPFPFTLSFPSLSLTPHTQIALGTLILLAGVLSLSWRLSTDPTHRTSFSQPPLTPGMGYTDASSTDSSPPTPSDPESAPAAQNGSASPLLASHPHRRSTSVSITYPRTPTLGRKGGITESEEIWEELEDEATSPLAPFRQRRASTMTPPSRDRKGARPQSGDGQPGPQSPTESTALLARPGTGRSYRDRRRSASGLDSRVLGGGGAGSGSGSGRPGSGSGRPGSGMRREERRRSGQQEALGGWWKMRWWSGKKSRDAQQRDGEG